VKRKSKRKSSAPIAIGSHDITKELLRRKYRIKGKNFQVLVTPEPPTGEGWEVLKSL
jgi:hypothetical protein